ncbi:MAG: hypothetical protein ABIK09_12995 [Pseudomonadota bacterium]
MPTHVPRTPPWLRRRIAWTFLILSACRGGGVPETGDAQSPETVLSDVPADAPVGPPPNPWPVPALDEEPAPTCPAAQAGPWYFQFLDNLCDEKVWPTDQDRGRMCPNEADSPFMTLQDGSVVEYLPSSAPVTWDIDALGGFLPAGMRMAVILIRRVDGVPYYRYLGSGTQDLPQQPWSTTKFLAAANAAATLRIQSQYQVGLTASVGQYKVGDLVTSMCLYDDSPFTSNGLGRYSMTWGGARRPTT